MALYHKKEPLVGSFYIPSLVFHLLQFKYTLALKAECFKTEIQCYSCWSDAPIMFGNVKMQKKNSYSGNSVHCRTDLWQLSSVKTSISVLL